MTDADEVNVRIQRMKIMAEKIKLMLAIEEDSTNDIKYDVAVVSRKVDGIEEKLGGTTLSVGNQDTKLHL